MNAFDPPPALAALTPAQLGRGLMRGSRAEFKTGYSAESAALAVIERHPHSDDEQLMLRAELLGFAHGLHGLDRLAATARLTERLPDATRYPAAVDAHRAGHLAGLEESTSACQPGPLDGRH